MTYSEVLRFRDLVAIYTYILKYKFSVARIDKLEEGYIVGMSKDNPSTSIDVMFLIGPECT